MGDAIPFLVGDRVAARWQGGAVYPGRIAGVRAGGERFDIDFDDGDHEEGVPAASIVRILPNAAEPDWGRAERIERAQDASGADIAVGDAVLARFQRGGVAYPGRVEAIGEIDGRVRFTLRRARGHWHSGWHGHGHGHVDATLPVPRHGELQVESRLGATGRD